MFNLDCQKSTNFAIDSCKIHFFNLNKVKTSNIVSNWNEPHGMSYSHFDNEVCNGTISFTHRDLIDTHYKLDPVVQWGKILVMSMGFADHLDLFLDALHFCTSNQLDILTFSSRYLWESS